MATTIRALSAAVAEQLACIPDVRVYDFEPDVIAPPLIVVQMPTIAWDSSERTFDTWAWTIPILIGVARTSDRAFQTELDRLIQEVAHWLGEDPSLGGVAEFSRLVSARPAALSASGVEYPGYELTLQAMA